MAAWTCRRQGRLLPRLCARPGSFRLDSRFNSCSGGARVECRIEPKGSTLAGEALEGKPVVIRRIARPQDAADCRILFISSTEENHLKEILAAIDHAGVL